MHSVDPVLRSPSETGARRWFAAAWRIGRWPLLGALVIAAFALGMDGFRLYFEEQRIAKSTSDLAYLSLQLFVFESGSVAQGTKPWQLEAARLLAPATTAITLLVASAAVFREQWSELRMSVRRRHTVLCGLGTKGACLAQKLIDAGHRLVVIEQDESLSAIRSLRRRGAVVVIGDARDEAVLRRAHVERASNVVALTGSDDANADIAIRAGSMAPIRQGKAVNCLAHVREGRLCVLLRAEELALGRSAGYRLDFFNVYEQGARAMLRDHPPRTGGDGQRAHLMVIGMDALGQSVVAEVGRQWTLKRGAKDGDLLVTVMAPDADRSADVLARRHPLLRHAVHLRAIGTDVDPLDTELLVSSAEPVPSVIYVCLEDDQKALAVALLIRRCRVVATVPVVVPLTRAAGIAKLLDHPSADDRLHAFHLLDRTLEADLLLGGTYETLARAIHDTYRAEQLRAGGTTRTNASLVPWEELPESLRESNRSQGAHIGFKLAAVGCGIAPAADWDAEHFTFSGDEIEMLAEIEHERWSKQRRDDGWRLGAKDVRAKTSPYLIPWNRLSEDIRELDRQTVRGIPSFLAQLGYQVVRGESPRDVEGTRDRQPDRVPHRKTLAG